MKRSKKIYNYTKCRAETVEQKSCPRCNGFGSLFNDKDGCPLCGGRGTLWYNKDSGLTLKINARVNSQQLY